MHRTLCAIVFVLSACIAINPVLAEVALAPIGRYETRQFNSSALEIAAYDPASKQLFIVNGTKPILEVVSIADPHAPERRMQIDLSKWGKGANSVAVHGNLVAVAVENALKSEPGKAVFFSVQGEFLNSVDVGILPDMLVFSPDGRHVLTANEGEPSADYTADPEGSISIIDLAGGAAALEQDDVRTAGFDAFSAESLPDGLRVFGPGASVAQDLEPEYIAVAPDSRTAWVTLQENNGLAIVDIPSATVTRLVALGVKDHRRERNAFDASDKDRAVHILPRPVFGMYQPDAIAAFNTGGNTYLITANEGDVREYAGFNEEVRVSDVTLDPQAFPDAAKLQSKNALGRLKITRTLGDADADGDYDALYCFGARSFSVWTTVGELVYDSGDMLERVTAQAFPTHFNADSDANDSFDGRSDDKGPEPEGLTVGVLDGVPYGFVALERIGGVAVVDLSDPSSPIYAGYVNTRNWLGDPAAHTAGDLSPEGVLFIPSAQSPNGKPLLVVTCEVSGSLTIFEITAVKPGK